MASTSLSSFASIDIRTVKQGDVVIFRTASLGHRPNLALRHGRTARVVGFGRNGQGAQQVSVAFLADARLGDAKDTKLSTPIALAASNLIPMSDKAKAAGKAAHDEVERVWAAASEKHGQQVAQAITVRQLQLALLEEGVFNSLDQPVTTPSTDLEDMPF